MEADVTKGFTLFIESGLHGGTVQRLASGLYTLGSGLEADIVLADAGIDAVHLIIELDQRGLRVEPLQGALVIDGEQGVLEPGGERLLGFPAVVVLGDVRIRITAPVDRMRAGRRVRVAGMATGCVLLLGLGLQLVGPLAVSARDRVPIVDEIAADEVETAPPIEDMAEAKPAGRTGSEPASEALIKPEIEPEVTLDQAATSLRRRLAEAKLVDIEVQTAVDRLIVRGELAPERMADWQAVRYGFDTSFGQKFLLVASIEAAEPAAPPDLAIEAIWSGDEPFLIAGGERFVVGAAVGDGWVIERIGPAAITFKRGDKIFSLTL